MILAADYFCHSINCQAQLALVFVSPVAQLPNNLSGLEVKQQEICSTFVEPKTFVKTQILEKIDNNLKARQTYWEMNIDSWKSAKLSF